MSLRAPISPVLRRGSKIATVPASEPVTADQLRAFLEQGSTALPDATANSYIKTAREYIERMTGIAMITQVWTLALDRWPTGREPWWDGVRQGAISELAGANRELELAKYPLISVDAVSVYDQSGAETAVTVATTFDVDTYSTPGRMALKDGQSWPVALRSTNAIEITYSAGYGASADDVPQPLKQAISQMAGFMYEHRGACSTGDAYSKSGAADLVAPYELLEI